MKWRPQRDSNPCFGLERATSWASGRWGPERETFKSYHAPPLKRRLTLANGSFFTITAAPDKDDSRSGRKGSRIEQFFCLEVLRIVGKWSWVNRRGRQSR